jgi:hypothetical protein
VRLSRNQLQFIRWTSGVLALAILASSWFWDARGGWAVLCFFGFLVIGTPGALITLHLMDSKSSTAEPR